MKRYLLSLLILLIAFPLYAQDWQEARMSVGVMGSGVAAVAGCAGGTTTYVGDTVVHAEFASQASDRIYCMAYAANCSGALTKANVSHHGTDTDSIKVSIFSKTGATPADEAQVTSASWLTITASTDAWIQSAGDVGGSATNLSNYWLCWIGGATANFPIHRDATTGTRTLYYKDSAGSYASPPTTLPGVTWTSTATRDYSIYISIGP